MTVTQLESRADRLFGRELELTQLLQRTQRSGLSAIVGPPQIGKSWLLMELAQRLDHERKPRCLVGFTRSPKGANDQLLEVVSDLYQRWLADAGAREQLRAVWEQQKDRLLPAFARFVGKLSEKAAKLVPIFGELGGTAIKESLEGLVTASEDLRSGRLIISRLEYNQAQELVSSVQKITGQRVSLVMDQWEENRDLDQQRKTLRDFLREPEQWPDCHILLGAREGGEAAELLYDLAAEYPGSAYVHTLGEIDLADGIERRRLIAYLHAERQLRALENIPDDRVLELVAGYPRVLNRWTAEDARDTAKTFDGLEQLAQDAHAFRYRDLEKLLLDLDGDGRKLAARIALTPVVEVPDAWRALRPIILANLDPNALDDLKLNSVLDKGAEAPRFGHAKRRDAARSFLDTRRPEAIRAEVQYLIPALARAVIAIDTTCIPFAEALGGFRDTAVQYNLGALLLALCEAARTLFDERPASPASVIEGVQQARRSREIGFVLVLSAGLVNMLHDANAEGDLARRDALLDELRGLAHDYPDDAAVREQLARGLEDALLGANGEDIHVYRNTLLEHVLAFARDYRDDAAAREQLARGLYARRDALLDELRGLAHDYPDDAAVREQLARGLEDALIRTKWEGLFAWHGAMRALLEHVRALARDYPDDAAMPGRLTRGFSNIQNNAKEELDLRRDALLDELRALARDYPDDAAVRERLAGGLFHFLNDAKEEFDLARRNALLDELRALARDYPDDAAVRERLAGGLFHFLNDAKEEFDLARRNALLDELRALAHTYPDDAAVRGQLLAVQKS